MGVHRYVTCIQTLTLSIAIVSGQYGFTSRDDDFGYLWYENEPFRMYCNSSAIEMTSSDYVTWETPRHEILSMPHTDASYELREWFGIEGFELFVKGASPHTHGVYVCRVFGKDGHRLRDKSIIALNIHDVKYASLYDKYRNNVARAFVAAGTMLALCLSFGTVYHFRYRQGTDGLEQSRTRVNQRKGVTESSEGYSMLWIPSTGAYDNVVWTKL